MHSTIENFICDNIGLVSLAGIHMCGVYYSTLQKCKGCFYPFSGHLSCKLYTSCQDWEFPFTLTTNSLLVYLISKQLCGHSKRNIPITDRMFIECATEITIKG